MIQSWNSVPDLSSPNQAYLAQKNLHSINTKILWSFLLVCYRMVKISNFSKRSGAATNMTNGLSFVNFSSSVFSLNAVLQVLE